MDSHAEDSSEWEARRTLIGCCVRCRRELRLCRCKPHRIAMTMCLNVCRSCPNWATDNLGRTGCRIYSVPCRIADHILNGGNCVDEPPRFTRTAIKY